MLRSRYANKNIGAANQLANGGAQPVFSLAHQPVDFPAKVSSPLKGMNGRALLYSVCRAQPPSASTEPMGRVQPGKTASLPARQPARQPGSQPGEPGGLAIPVMPTFQSCIHVRFIFEATFPSCTYLKCHRAPSFFVFYVKPSINRTLTYRHI